MAQPLRLEKRITLHVEGRIDHMAADVKGNRLFMAALGNNTVEVIDLAAGTVTRSLKGFHEPQGVYYWAAGDRLYVANGQSGNLDVLDGHTFTQIHAYDFSGDADNVRFDAATKEVYVGYGDGALGVVNAEIGSRVGDTMLTAHPESFQLENSGPRIFVNVPNAENVTVVDRRTRAVKVKWPLTGAKSNFPMALDEADHRLFVGCRKPAKLLVLDTGSGKEVAAVDIVGDTDDLFYDAALKRIYVSGGAGAITVLQQKDADHYHELAKIPTASRARTSLFVPDLKRLYVAVPHQGKQPSELLVFATE
jgi:DNA-binding beta-propeller fold protein YncE